MPGQSKNNSKKYGLGRSNAEELLLPSGNTCLVKRPGVQGLIKAGLLDDLDSLTAIVQVDHIDANDPKKMMEAVNKMAADPSRITDALEVVDKALCFAVVAPKVFRPIRTDEDGKPVLLDGKEIPLEDDERIEGTIYSDEVDEEDKMFIFNFLVGGTRDVESFRAESKAMLGGVPAGQDVPMPPQ